MKKKGLISKIFLIASVALAALFLVIIIIDYIQYDSLTNSAPFDALILVRGCEFLVPSIICYGFGMIFKDKKNK